MDKNSREKAKDTFLKYTGKVIKKHRIDNNLKQENLAKAVGSSDSAISRYEKGEGDITAAMMSYISLELGFPLKEYTEFYEYAANGERERVPVDRILMSLVTVANKEYLMQKLSITPEITGTKLNEDTRQYEFAMGQRVSDIPQEPIQYDPAPMIVEYMVHDESGAKPMLTLAYNMIKGKNTISKPTQDLVGAILVYVEEELANDNLRPHIKEYIKRILSRSVQE